MRIHRLTIPVTDRQIVKLPWPQLVLSTAPARTGGEYLDIWFADDDFDRTEPGLVKKDVIIHISGTGHPIPADIDVKTMFVGTCVMPSHLVWHVFATQQSNERNTP